jgi:hypothetical protein
VKTWEKRRLNPEFAWGISENMGGRVKRVKKVKCYNVDTGGLDSEFGRAKSGKVPSKDAFMSSIRPLTSAPVTF